jgi:hypothetical protein
MAIYVLPPRGPTRSASHRRVASGDRRVVQDPVWFLCLSTIRDTFSLRNLPQSLSYSPSFILLLSSVCAVFHSSPRTVMAQPHPASTTSPLYLTGNKAGLQEFLDKFDVGPPNSCVYELADGLIYSSSSRSSYSTAMVRRYPEPCDLGLPSALLRRIRDYTPRQQSPSANPGSRCPMVWRPLLPWDSRDPRIATKEWCGIPTSDATGYGGSHSRLGKQVVFVTNNSTKSRADYRKKLEALGIPSSVVSEHQPRGKSKSKTAGVTNTRIGRDILVFIQFLDIHFSHPTTPRKQAQSLRDRRIRH